MFCCVIFFSWIVKFVWNYFEVIIGLVKFGLIDFLNCWGNVLIKWVFMVFIVNGVLIRVFKFVIIVGLMGG